MRRRWCYLLLAAVLGAAVAVLPGVAASESLPVEAVNEGIYYHHWSNAVQTILAGESVKFANPGSEVPHGLKFTGGPAAPVCSGIPAAAGEASGAVNWHGECSFATPGTYTFICTVHPVEMKGTITVSASGTTTVTTTPTTPAPTTTAPKEGSPPVSPLVGAPSLRARQRGGVVKGAMTIATAGAGDELNIDVFASTSALVGRRHVSGRTRVGHLTRASVKAGRLPFSIRLDAKARRALVRRRLALTVRIVLEPVYGEATTINRSVLERG